MRATQQKPWCSGPGAQRIGSRDVPHEHYRVITRALKEDLGMCRLAMALELLESKRSRQYDDSG